MIARAAGRSGPRVASVRSTHAREPVCVGPFRRTLNARTETYVIQTSCIHPLHRPLRCYPPIAPRALSPPAARHPPAPTAMSAVLRDRPLAHTLPLLIAVSDGALTQTCFVLVEAWLICLNGAKKAAYEGVICCGLPVWPVPAPEWCRSRPFHGQPAAEPPLPPPPPNTPDQPANQPPSTQRLTALTPTPITHTPLHFTARHCQPQATPAG